MRHQQKRYAGDHGAAEAAHRARRPTGLPTAGRAASGRGSLLLRVAVAASRARLDRDLADGVSPSRTPRHALRARQLTATSSRAGLAEVLGDLSELTACPPAPNRIEPSRTALARCAPQIEALTARLNGPGALYAGGLAQLRRLLVDGAGALYTDRRGDDLSATLVAIDAALSGSPAR